VALNRGRHLHVYSAGRPSRWALAHIIVCYFFEIFASFLLYEFDFFATTLLVEVRLAGGGVFTVRQHGVAYGS